MLIIGCMEANAWSDTQELCPMIKIFLSIAEEHGYGDVRSVRYLRGNDS